ncbi:unnamed protein product [Ilex paraguariensis]|uniref:Uncharacterized protein n=1 Tax=Ilex paraguariensis TaxID=185542 RepID=A0ABC8URR7_9AQUA
MVVGILLSWWWKLTWCCCDWLNALLCGCVVKVEVVAIDVGTVYWVAPYFVVVLYLVCALWLGSWRWFRVQYLSLSPGDLDPDPNLDPDLNLDPDPDPRPRRLRSDQVKFKPDWSKSGSDPVQPWFDPGSAGSGNFTPVQTGSSVFSFDLMVQLSCCSSSLAQCGSTVRFSSPKDFYSLVHLFFTPVQPGSVSFYSGSSVQQSFFLWFSIQAVRFISCLLFVALLWNPSKIPGPLLHLCLLRFLLMVP